jgi:tRNA pseudouridine38-40 synthase
MKSFEGKKDFAAFANSGHSVKSTIRNILSVTCEEELRSSDRGRLIRLRFTGEGFLKQQVRNMVGALVAVSTRKRPVDFIPGLLEASQGPLTRIPSLFCAPPEGLFLLKVNYARPLFPSEA